MPSVPLWLPENLVLQKKDSLVIGVPEDEGGVGSVQVFESEAAGSFLHQASLERTNLPGPNQGQIETVGFGSVVAVGEKSLAGRTWLAAGVPFSAGPVRGSDPPGAFHLMPSDASLLFTDGFESGGTGSWD